MPYMLNGDKPYNGKTDKNKRSWDIVVNIITQGKGKADLGAIQKALTSYKWKDKDGGEQETTHPNFARYMIRGRHIIEVPKK